MLTRGIPNPVISRGSLRSLEGHRSRTIGIRGHPDRTENDTSETVIMVLGERAPSLESKRTAGLPTTVAGAEYGLTLAWVILRAFDLLQLALAAPNSINVSPRPQLDLGTADGLVDTRGL